MKEELISMITTYANARSTGDVALIDFAGTRLNAFLAKVDVVEVEPAQLEEVSFRD